MEEAGPGDEVRVLIRTGDHAGARDLLRLRQGRSPEENVLLAESCLALRDIRSAEEAFYEARVQGPLERDLEYRVLVGLGDLALLKNDAYGAAARFVEARTAAVARAEWDRALVGQARGELLAGNVSRAIKLRDQVSMPSVTGLGRLDADLARVAPRTVAKPKKPRPLKKVPAGRRKTLKGPSILDRGRWRARRIISRRAENMGRINSLTVHHTAEKRPLRSVSLGEAAARMRSFQADHMNGKKWADIGYHYVIDQTGRIWQGRSVRYQGAHAGSKRGTNANRGNIGVALMGNFEKSAPSAGQKRALRDLMTWLVAKHGIPVSRLYTHGEIKKKMRIGGTACPGRHLAWMFSRLRDEMRGKGTARRGG